MLQITIFLHVLVCVIGLHAQIHMGTSVCAGTYGGLPLTIRHLSPSLATEQELDGRITGSLPHPYIQMGARELNDAAIYLLNHYPRPA